jgi:structure-specific recognition protein 1
MPFTEISAVTFARVSAASANSTKTFEMKISLKGGHEFVFSSIAREEYSSLETFCSMKELNVRNEVGEDVPKYRDFSDDERGNQNDGFMTESEDEDFIGGAGSGESDVAEEFNEDYSSSSEDGDGNEKEIEQKINEDKPAETVKKPVAKKRKEVSTDDNDKKKKRAKKDKNAPKRPMTAFILFSNEYRTKVVSENPGSSIGDVAKILGAKWKEITEQEKKIFEAKAAQDKLRYQAEMEVYAKSGGAVESAKPEKPASKGHVKEEFKSEEFVQSDSD